MLYRAKELSRRWNFGSTESHFIRIVEKPEVREQWTPFYSLGMVTPLERPLTTGVPWDSEFFFLLHLLQPLLINLVLILQFLPLCTHIPRETSLRPFYNAPHYHLDSKTFKQKSSTLQFKNCPEIHVFWWWTSFISITPGKRWRTRAMMFEQTGAHIWEERWAGHLDFYRKLFSWYVDDSKARLYVVIFSGSSQRSSPTTSFPRHYGKSLEVTVATVTLFLVWLSI